MKQNYERCEARNDAGLVNIPTLFPASANPPNMIGSPRFTASRMMVRPGSSTTFGGLNTGRCVSQAIVPSKACNTHKAQRRKHEHTQNIITDCRLQLRQLTIERAQRRYGVGTKWFMADDLTKHNEYMSKTSLHHTSARVNERVGNCLWTIELLVGRSRGRPCGPMDWIGLIGWTDDNLLKGRHTGGREHETIHKDVTMITHKTWLQITDYSCVSSLWSGHKDAMELV